MAKDDYASSISGIADVINALAKLAEPSKDEMLRLSANLESQRIEKSLAMQAKISKEATKDRQNFQKELAREAWDKKIAFDYPGVTIDSDGLPDFTGYDFSKTSAAKAARSASVVEDLRQYNLPYEGTDTENIQTLTSFLQGRAKGTGIMASSVSPDVALQMGDRTPGYFTEHDVSDFQEWFEGSGGADSPVALNQLVESGIISSDNLQMDKSTGLYTANDRSKQLIDYAFQGLKQGAKANESFKTIAAYEAMDEEKRFKNLQFAESITGHPRVVRATNIFNSTKVAVGANKINAQTTESGDYTILWKGRQVGLNDVMEVIDEQEGVFTTKSEKANFKAFFNNIATIGRDGMGMETVLLEANANPRMLIILSKFDRSLANSLLTAQTQFNEIEKISRLAGHFIQSPTPRTNEQVVDFRSYIQDNGLAYKFQALRVMEASGETDTKEYEELDLELQNMIPNIINEIRKTGDKVIETDFMRWLELEESTGQLFKQSAARRAGI